MKKNIPIGQMLLNQGVITAEGLETALHEQKKTGDFICTALAKLGLAPEENIFNVLSEKLGLPYVKLRDFEATPSIIQMFPAKISSHYKVFPLYFQADVLVVALADPQDVRKLDDIRLLLGKEIKGVLASAHDIEEAIRKHYGIGADTLEKMNTGNNSNSAASLITEKAQDLEVIAEDASIVKFVNQMLSEAIRDRATDLHLEPFQDELRVRFRIDGVLYDINIPDTVKYFHAAIVSRIKIMSHLNIAERRLPQDGRLKIKLDGQELDLRISTIPTAFGESLHIRILSPQLFLEMSKLGLSGQDLKTIGTMIKKPHGIIFVTGPTGSGKTTTLYAALAHINSSEVKIITIEDPIEYQLKGVNQIQVSPKIGLTFATGLRHMLRHDPDVMMVGEVRDYETAEIAIRAALTGHLVFSTLHTNDAAGAVTRLLDMGVEPFLLSSSLECLIAQRLVRLICPKCKSSVQYKEEIFDLMSKDISFDRSKAQVYEGKGCEHCRFTGYRGRTGIHEILPVNRQIRELIIEHASSQVIKQKAISQGMRTLRQEGLQKVLDGLTTFSEVVRVTQQEDSA